MIKADEVIGGLFGLLLFYCWLFFLDNLAYAFFSETNTIQGAEIVKMNISVQIFEWFAVGLLMLFLVFGHYIIRSLRMNVNEKRDDDKIIKANLIGFVIWLMFIIVAFIFHVSISHSVNIGGGYITILIIYVLLLKF